MAGLVREGALCPAGGNPALPRERRGGPSPLPLAAPARAAAVGPGGPGGRAEPAPGHWHGPRPRRRQPHPFHLCRHCRRAPDEDTRNCGNTGPRRHADLDVPAWPGPLAEETPSGSGPGARGGDSPRALATIPLVAQRTTRDAGQGEWWLRRVAVRRPRAGGRVGGADQSICPAAADATDTLPERES